MKGLVLFIAFLTLWFLAIAGACQGWNMLIVGFLCIAAIVVSVVGLLQVVEYMA